ncbi:inositol monophosphatase family protein [Texcoconibacillus texcoconensis]|uniref:inositol-phosphate phosphatase n=1 Tax=Texcoconibacillus texcoconensis TaxID=1095777 RepID=A0A840QLI9_9BACI|nr:myo-inositol-1(or 4)-monophosphatase [Texcoconibacillus texcoconensis]
MKDYTWDYVYDKAVQLVHEAGDRIRSSMSEVRKVETKSHVNDLVTDMDRAIETFFAERVQATFPTHHFLGEEGAGHNLDVSSGTLWVLDPIDGTVNFVHQQSFFAISLAVFHEGTGKIGIVYDVMRDEIFTAQHGKGAFRNNEKLPQLKSRPFSETILSFNAGWILKDRSLEQLIVDCRGVRSYGVAALEMAYVACGRLDAYLSYNLAPWDIAAGMIILEEVGGRYMTLEGEELTLDGKTTLLAAEHGTYEGVLDRMARSQTY